MAQKTITRWQPIAELADLRSRFDRVFAEFTDGGHAPWTPAIDVVRNDSGLSVHVEVPGVEPDDVEIEVSDGMLTISGHHEEREDREDETYVRRERRFGSFSRSIALPAGADPSAVTAKSHQGVLEIAVPLPAKPEHRTVKVVPEGE